MRETVKSLPEDPTELRAVSELMAAGIKSQAYQIEKLKTELAAHRKARFGARSGSMDQLAFDLQEDTGIEAAAKAQKTAAKNDETAPAKRTHNRAPLPDHLERQEKVLSPGDACGDCGGALKQHGEDGEPWNAIGPSDNGDRRAGICPRPLRGEADPAAAPLR